MMRDVRAAQAQAAVLIGIALWAEAAALAGPLLLAWTLVCAACCGGVLIGVTLWEAATYSLPAEYRRALAAHRLRLVALAREEQAARRAMRRALAAQARRQLARGGGG